MMPKKISTIFSHDPDAGVRCIVPRVLREPDLHGRVLVGGVVVHDQVQLDPC